MFFLPTTLSPAETLLDLQKFVLRRMIIKRVSVSRADGSVIEALAKVLEGYQLEKLTVEETAVTEELLLSHLRHHHRISEALLLRLVSATRPKCFKLSAPTLPLSKSFFLHPVIQSDVQDLDLNVCWIHHSSYSEMAVTSYCSPDLSEFDDATLLTLRKEHLSLKLRTHMTLQGLNAFGKHFLANPEMRSAYLSFDTTQPIWLSEGRFIRIPRTVWPRNNERVISHKDDLITENGEEYEVSLLDGTCFMPIPSTLISYTIIFRYKDV